MNLQAYLEGGLDPWAVEQLRATLWAFPWGWPTGGSAASTAQRAIGSAEPPAVPVGHAPILADDGQDGAVFLVTVATTPEGLVPHTPAPPVWEVIREIRAEVARHVPLRSDTPLPVFFAIDAVGVAVRTLPDLDGRSLGLSVALARASASLRRAIPAHIAMSACVHPGGRLGTVEGWTAKARAVLDLLPRVTTLLVAAGDVGEAADAIQGLGEDGTDGPIPDARVARNASAEPVVDAETMSTRRLVEVTRAGRHRRIEVVGVATSLEAFHFVFERDAQRSAVADLEPRERSNLARRLFADALLGTGSFVYWGPAAQVLDEALKWEGPEPDTRDQVLFARAVAERFARADAEPQLPDLRWLDRLPGNVRSQVTAHLLQHHTRWGGDPDPRLVKQVGRDGKREETPARLKVRGAHARWLDARGKHRSALQEHQRVVAAWLRLYEDPATSYSLSEWLRLAGALNDEGAFREAMETMDELERQAAFDQNADMYLTLGRAQGAWALSLRGGERWADLARASIERLQRLPADQPNLARVRRIALRYSVYLDRDDHRARRILDQDMQAGVDRHLLLLLDEPTNLREWTHGLPEHHRWRACILLDQKEDAEHLLRFFVDA